MPEHDEPLTRYRTATYPGAQLDRLFRPTYKHVTSNQTCIDCNETGTWNVGPVIEKPDLMFTTAPLRQVTWLLKMQGHATY